MQRGPGRVLGPTLPRGAAPGGGASAREAVRSRSGLRVDDLHPAYFAFVMATGIVAIALELQRARALALVLTAVGVVGYAVLWGLSLVRLASRPRAVLADLSDHG